MDPGRVRVQPAPGAEQDWLPVHCTAHLSQAWLDTNFPSNSRDEIVLFQAENVLTPQSLQQMWRFYQNISAITVSGKTFADMCEK